MVTARSGTNGRGASVRTTRAVGPVVVVAVVTKNRASPGRKRANEPTRTVAPAADDGTSATIAVAPRNVGPAVVATVRSVRGTKPLPAVSASRDANAPRNAVNEPSPVANVDEDAIETGTADETAMAAAVVRAVVTVVVARTARTARKDAKRSVRPARTRRPPRLAASRSALFPRTRLRSRAGASKRIAGSARPRSLLRPRLAPRTRRKPIVIRARRRSDPVYRSA